MDKELLFVLIIIITVVINIVKAIKKKNAPVNGAPAEVEHAEDDFQEVLRKFMGGEPRAESVKQAEPEYESLETLIPLGGHLEKQRQYSFEKPEYTRSSFEMEGFEVERSTESAQQPPPLGAAPYYTAAFTAENFDLRQGILYDAILNRPKY